MSKMIKLEGNDTESSVSQRSIPFKTQTKDFRTYPVDTFSGNPKRSISVLIPLFQ